VRLGALLTRRPVASDLQDELEAHLQLAADDYVESGLAPDDARHAARRLIGNERRALERGREAWRFVPWDDFVQDLRIAVRGLRRAPGFALLATLTLGLGIGAATAIFSVLYAVVLRPLPYPHGERLVWLGESSAQARGISVTWGNLQRWRERSRAFDGMAGFERGEAIWTGRGDAQLVRTLRVSNGFFDVLGARALMGRLLDAGDDRAGAAPVVVVSHDLWATRLGADPRAVGTTLVLDGQPHRVVGVLPPGWRFTEPRTDGYVPLGPRQSATPRRDAHGSIRAVGRLASGVSVEAARDDLDGVMKGLAAEDPGPEADHHSEVRALAGLDARASRPMLLTLMAAVGAILLIACVNVANLILARNVTRGRELAIRASIGAGPFRLGRQLLTEQLVILSLGGAVALLVAAVARALVVQAGPPGIPRLDEAGLDVHVLAFGAGLMVATGLLVGVASFRPVRGRDLLPALGDGGRRTGASPRTRALAGILVVAEVAMTLVLAFACALLVRSLVAAHARDPGFAADRLLRLQIRLPRGRYDEARTAQAYYERLAADLRALPGAAGVGLVSCPPPGGGCKDWFYSVLDRPAPARDDVPVSLLNTVDPAYFAAMRIPIREGRGFSPHDDRGTARVAVVNEAFARRWWPAGSAVGQRFQLGGPYIGGPTYEIVGVAGDVSQAGLDSGVEPEVYLAFAQDAGNAMSLVVRTAAEPELLIPAVKTAVARLDPDVPVLHVQPLARALAATLARRTFTTGLLVSFAAIALVLAFVGIYGLLRGWVAAREPDIAIRMALGARRTTIFGWAGRQALRLCGAGILLGGVLGWAFARSLDAVLFAVEARSPAALALATGAVGAVAMAAAAGPLWRATRVDALRVLSHG
jgi:putative ABC transport system permease protein